MAGSSAGSALREARAVAGRCPAVTKAEVESRAARAWGAGGNGMGGYWQPLLALIDHVIAEGFADASLKHHFQTVPDVPALEAALATAFG